MPNGTSVPADPHSWTTLAQLRRLSKASWDKGQLLRELVTPTETYPRRRPLKRPTAAELRNDYAAAHSWAAELFAAAGKYTLETADVGRTTIGSNRLPSAAVFATVEDEIAFAGKSAEAARFQNLAARLGELDAALGSWIARRPLQLLDLGDAAPIAAQAAMWLRDNPAPGIYVRQLSLPGVHTKFVETHRRTIDEMADALQLTAPIDAAPGIDEREAAKGRHARAHDMTPPDAADHNATAHGITPRDAARKDTTAQGVPNRDAAGRNSTASQDVGVPGQELTSPNETDQELTAQDLTSEPTGAALLGDADERTPAARFAARHGFLHPPEQIRFRILDPDIVALGNARDISVTAEAFGSLSLPIKTVITTENLINFLTLPERPRTLALFGRGYGFSALREAAWLRNCNIIYWGDLDTHGFRILDQLRAVHPHVTSILMDQQTLLSHRDAWVREPSPSRAPLTRLTAAESALYNALGNDEFGPAVRLEQELIRWDWALHALPPQP
ncbi:hypothetical protein IV498_10995 [Paenarthrobacter sp. Z7-10]|uniref:Wadjet anti-phage system protein JetD domain-containing protein n=1 Tax=Paenarthrobacter sp. Z7-10 TaxID=2787635 RepID=UPI0022A964E5|nr:DUF3322 and DUF2220 domain-containing protein [Paenarthrobacter sp. Z7-10]MCZ2403696.1 hypothetical protein [Paenarthrobacter sp. Z7-10]